MRTVYRISLAKHARDLSGKGARMMGGRWNPKDTSALYTSESRSLAAMEYLVHMSLMNVPPKVSITSIGMPKSIVPKQIRLSNLPKNWRGNPAPFILGEIGVEWLSSMECLWLRVPSAVVMHEFNILINPLHPDIKTVKILKVEKFLLDERLSKSPKRG